jgi:hypothetical protein
MDAEVERLLDNLETVKTRKHLNSTLRHHYPTLMYITESEIENNDIKFLICRNRIKELVTMFKLIADGFIMPVPDTYPVRYFNPFPLTLKESHTMHNDSLTDPAVGEQIDLPLDTDRACPPLVEEPVPQYSTICKVEIEAHRLKDSLVIAFDELCASTKDREGPKAGALLVVLTDAENEPHEVWIPKKLCSNLDLENNTVCVWDVIMNKKIEELGGLAYEPMYHAEFMADITEPASADVGDGE